MSRSGAEPDDDGDGVLVEEGAFRVDRRRALDKLMRYQLPDPAMFVLMLVRCAVAGGATRIRFDPKRSGKGIEISFDGEPFDAETLRMPYAALFERANKTVRRNRQLAIALLSALRLEPKWITVRSGEGKNRVGLLIRSLTEERLDASPDGDSGTVVVVSGPSLAAGHEILLRTRCEMSPIPIIFHGEPILRDEFPGQRAGRYEFATGDVRGWMAIPDKPSPNSFLKISRYGVFVSNARHRMPVGQIEGSVNADGLSVSASQFGLIRNSVYKKTMAAVGRHVVRFAMNESSLHFGRIKDACALMESPFVRRRWSGLIAQCSAQERRKGLLSWFGDVVSGLPITEAQERLLADCAKRTVWLRAAAKRVCGPDAKNPDPALRKALWSAGLFLSADLEPFSLAEMEEQRRSLGYVPTCRTAYPGLKAAFRAVWLASPEEEEFIGRFFPAGLAGVDDAFAEESQLRRMSPSKARLLAKPRLERVGLSSVLERSGVDAGGLEGEVGLPFHRREDGARVHVFDLGKPTGWIDAPGRLRWAAALKGDTHLLRREISHAPAELPARIGREVLDLYRRAAEDYDMNLRGAPRQDQLRAHLFDFLLWCADRKDERLKPHSWIARVPLFVQQGGASWSYEAILKAFAAGETLYFSPSGSKARGFPGSLLFVDGDFTESRLASLFPDCAAKRFPGVEDLLLAYAPVSRRGAAAVVTLGGRAFEAGVGTAAGGKTVEAPFGAFTVYSEDAPASTVDLSVGARLVSGVLREFGSRGLEPGSPMREWLVKAVKTLFAPWPGKAYDGDDLRHAMELLVMFPFFRRPEGAPWSIAELHARLAKNPRMKFRRPHRKTTGCEIELDASEEELFRALWPKDSDGLIDAEGPALVKKARPAEPPEPAPAKTAPAAMPPPPAPVETVSPASAVPPAAEGPPLRFSTPMLYEKEIRGERLRALIGLPPELIPGLSVVVLRDGKSRRYWLDAKGISLAGSMLVDANGWGAGIAEDAKTLAPEFRKAVVGLYNRLFYGLLDVLPNANPASSGYDAVLLYLLYLLRGEDEDARALGPEWSPLRQRIRSSPLIPLLGGGRASIERLLERAKTEGKLVYTEDRSVAMGPATGGIPVFRYPRLAAGALGGVPFERYKTPAARGETERVPEFCGMLSPDERIGRRFKELLSELRGRRGLDLAHCPEADSFALVDSRSRDAVPGFKTGAWQLNRSHPLVSRVLSAKISPEAKAEFLASLAYTEANRRAASITDAEDSKFQRALAHAAVRREP